MDAKTLKLYRAARTSGWSAAQALRRAKTLIAWDNADGYNCGEYDAPADPDQSLDRGWIRIVETPDDSGYDASYIDTWDIPESERERLKNETYERCNRDGVWGYQAQVWTGDEWETVDSTWGFIGDDFTGSGYDDDLMQAALDAMPALKRLPELYPA